MSEEHSDGLVDIEEVEEEKGAQAGRPSAALNLNNNQNQSMIIVNKSEQLADFKTKIVEERKLASSRNMQQEQPMASNKSYSKKQHDDYDD